jgi:hypothetical protein
MPPAGAAGLFAFLDKISLRTISNKTCDRMFYLKVVLGKRFWKRSINMYWLSICDVSI